MANVQFEKAQPQNLNFTLMHTITISNLLTQLGNISTTQPWEQNEKQVLNVFLQTVAKTQAPDAGQLATLLAVGEQCPRTGGPAAVFFAAILYEGFTGERLTQDECGAAARSKEKLQKDGSPFLPFQFP
jgi:hypothetical protein